MNRRELSLNKIRKALEHESIPHTYKQLSKLVDISQSHISHIVVADADLYCKLVSNKKVKRIKFLTDRVKRIRKFAKHNGVTITAACVLLGFNKGRHREDLKTINHLSVKTKNNP